MFRKHLCAVLFGTALAICSPSTPSSADTGTGLAHVLQFEVFQESCFQTGGNGFSAGLGWWPTFITLANHWTLGIGATASPQKKFEGGLFVAGDLVAHFGYLSGSWGIEATAGLSDWLGFGGTALEYGGRYRQAFPQRVLGLFSGAYAGYSYLNANLPTHQAQVGALINL